MSVRHVFCEGPDDVAAIREIGKHFFGLKVGPEIAPAAGWRRSATLTGSSTIRIVAVKHAKSGLAQDVAIFLAGLRGQDDEERITHVTAVFDPDEAPAEAFESDIQRAIADEAKDWSLSPNESSRWRATRSEPADTIELDALAWRARDEAVPNMLVAQSLDRLLCTIATDAYPQHHALIEEWIEEARTALAKKSLSWKAALHLWCALVAPKQNEISAPTAFLHQDKICEPHARQLLQDVGLMARFAVLFGADLK